MKLGITEQNGVCTLTGTGEVSGHDVDVLKAGVAKLLGSGKSRVVIELPPQVSPDIIKEIQGMVAAAAGKLSLKSDAPEAPRQVEATPQYKAEIRQKELAEGDIKKRVEKLQKQNEVLIEQLKTALLARRVPPGDAALRSEISALEEKIAELLGQRATKGKKD